MKIAESMSPGQKGKMRLNASLNSVRISHKILVAQPQESRMSNIVF
jgi:hypothetical protein